MAIFAFSIYIPLAIFVIMFICLMKNDLEKRYPEIMAELQKRSKINIETKGRGLKDGSVLLWIHEWEKIK